MKIDILSLFPGMYDGFLNESIIKRAIDKKLININIINFRDYSPLNNKMVDDTIYGGGPGMLLRCEPIFECINDIKKDNSYIVILSPEGVKYNQKIAKRYSKIEHLIIICGHYEGFDERIKTLADEIISIGDYILTGGEIASMAMVDSITRLIPGVINKDSLKDESFEDDLLDYPLYTKPRVYNDLEVPEVLLSGDHKKIDEYRKKMRKEKTEKLRKDLMEKKWIITY